MNGISQQMAVFSLGDMRVALHLSAVKRIVRIVEISPLPGAPEIIKGVINVQGEVIPVFNIRKRFSLSDRETELSDQIILARTSRRTVGLHVDRVNEVLEVSFENIVAAEKILPEIQYFDGVVKTGDGLILIHDLDRFLSIEEEADLDSAMKYSGSL
jgi:purine-binding chemotaxis protein CheW